MSNTKAVVYPFTGALDGAHQVVLGGPRPFAFGVPTMSFRDTTVWKESGRCLDLDALCSLDMAMFNVLTGKPDYLARDSWQDLQEALLLIGG